MSLLVWSILTLLIGPLVYEWARERNYFVEVVDGFVFIAISSLLFLHFLEGFSETLSLVALGCLILGFLGPNILEKRLTSAAKTVHKTSLLIGVIGILVHAALDGASLAISSTEHVGHLHVSSHLPIAIILHRIPVALTLWWLLRPIFSRNKVLIVFGLMVLATCFGWASGLQLIAVLPDSIRHSFEAFIAGSILHVVFFRVHLDTANGEHAHSCCHTEESQDAVDRSSVGEAIGNLLGLLFCVVLVVSDPELYHTLEEPLGIFVYLALESAPALLIAYVLAGALYAFLPQASYQWLNKGGRSTQALKGVCFGLPLPICSCGVLPLYKNLIDNGVSRTAALAFLIATPELGLDAVLISIPLLGGHLTFARLIAAFLLAFIVAWVLGSVTSSTKKTLALAPKEKSTKDKLKVGVRYGMIELVDATGPWILFGLAVAAFAKPVLDTVPLSLPYQLDILVFAAVGVLVYVCATGATPLVAIFLGAGLSPGAGLAFLLTGPATNVSTFGILTNLHGRKLALSFGLGCAVLACVIGLVANVFFADLLSFNALEASHHHTTSLQMLCLVGVTLLFTLAIFRRGGRRFFGEIFGGEVHGAVDHVH